MLYNDIIKTEVKIINGDKWQFEFRENGYCIVSAFRVTQAKGKDVISWQRYLHGVSVESCLQYVYSTYNGDVGFLEYDELESA